MAPECLGFVQGETSQDFGCSVGHIIVIIAGTSGEREKDSTLRIPDQT